MYVNSSLISKLRAIIRTDCHLKRLKDGLITALLSLISLYIRPYNITVCVAYHSIFKALKIYHNLATKFTTHARKRAIRKYNIQITRPSSFCIHFVTFFLIRTYPLEQFIQRMFFLVFLYFFTNAKFFFFFHL